MGNSGLQLSALELLSQNHRGADVEAYMLGESRHGRDLHLLTEEETIEGNWI